MINLLVTGILATCSRNSVGSAYLEQDHLYSKNGALEVTFKYQTATDPNNNILFCYVTPDNKQSPTLHIYPGDSLKLTLVNDVANNGTIGLNVAQCGVTPLSASSTNVHFHGTDTLPICQSDEVVKTVIESGQTFTYNLQIPQNESPGLYWMHPHIYGFSENALLGGASAAIIIEGIENVQPEVSELKQRIITIRDNLVPGSQSGAPTWDLSMNYIPIPFPVYTTVKMSMSPNGKELFRVLNAAADSILNLALIYDDKQQPLQLVELDGVAVNSDGDSKKGISQTQNTILLGPGARASFIVNAPGVEIKNATFATLFVDTGPAGDSDPDRPLAQILLSSVADSLTSVPKTTGDNFKRSSDDYPSPSTTRILYFSEAPSDPNDKDSEPDFFISEKDEKPQKFTPGQAPSIDTTLGDVEDWIIENRATEIHVFHLHTMHFKLLERDGQAVSNSEQQVLDTTVIPYWKGEGNPFPSIKVRIRFNIAGDIMYHCHILGHEDAGMMAYVRVGVNEKSISGMSNIKATAVLSLILCNLT